MSDAVLLQCDSYETASLTGKLEAALFGGLISAMKRRPVIDQGTCVDCGLCVESCPVKAIDRATKAIDYSACIECLCCHELCVQAAVELKHLSGSRSRRRERLAGAAAG